MSRVILSGGQKLGKGLFLFFSACVFEPLIQKDPSDHRNKESAVTGCGTYRVKSTKKTEMIPDGEDPPGEKLR
jgi:hypothetical protein